MIAIELVDLEFFAYHGVYEQERTAGNNFRVSLLVEGDFYQAVNTDVLDGTINYEVLFDIITREMHIPSNLLEHVAGRIRKGVLETFPETQKIIVSIEKLNPPIKGKCKATRVTLTEQFN